MQEELSQQEMVEQVDEQQEQMVILPLDSVQHDEDELKQEDEVDEQQEKVNSMDETEVEHTEQDEDEDDDEEMEVQEIVVVQMIKEQDEEVDISLLNEWMEQILKEEEVQRIQMVEQR